MSAQDHICLREFRASDLEALLRLIHDTIDVSYPPAYPARAIQFFKDFHSETKILERRQRHESLGYEITGSHSMDVGESQRLDYWEARKRLR